jgi:hypothetical protein
VSVLVRLASKSSPVDVASFSPVGRLASSLRSIDQLDKRSRCLTIANNWAYYNLGTVYKAFCVVIRPSSPSLLLSIPTPYPNRKCECSAVPQHLIFYAVALVCDRLQSSREDVSPAWDSKPEQKRLVDLVLAHGDIADYIKSGNGNGNGDGNSNGNSSGTSRKAIKKRLQRARKFLMIVELFGTTVLNAAPDVSVSRLDLVSLQLLAGLVQEGNGNRTVETIRRNIGLVR